MWDVGEDLLVWDVSVESRLLVWDVSGGKCEWRQQGGRRGRRENKWHVGQALAHVSVGR